MKDASIKSSSSSSSCDDWLFLSDSAVWLFHFQSSSSSRYWQIALPCTQLAVAVFLQMVERNEMHFQSTESVSICVSESDSSCSFLRALQHLGMQRHRARNDSLFFLRKSCHHDELIEKCTGECLSQLIRMTFLILFLFSYPFFLGDVVLIGWWFFFADLS